MDDKKTYEINIEGCDDHTLFQVELTQEEFEIIKKICIKSGEVSGYNCQPTMYIY